LCHQSVLRLSLVPTYIPPRPFLLSPCTGCPSSSWPTRRRAMSELPSDLSTPVPSFPSAQSLPSNLKVPFFFPLSFAPFFRKPAPQGPARGCIPPPFKRDIFFPPSLRSRLPCQYFSFFPFCPRTLPNPTQSNSPDPKDIPSGPSPLFQEPSIRFAFFLFHLFGLCGGPFFIALPWFFSPQGFFPGYLSPL